MAEKTQSAAPKKRRWYHNLKDAFTLTRRVYPWIPWAMIGASLAVLALFVGIGFAFSSPIMWTVVGVISMPAAAMLLLSAFVQKAMYSQLDGHVGAASAVLSQIKRGWIISTEPLTADRAQNLVWRAIGRAGIVLIGEAPGHKSTLRLTQLLDEEAKKAARIVPNVPIHRVVVGHDDKCVPIAKLSKAIRKFPNALTNAEVPAIEQRLTSLQRVKQGGIPKGVDPARLKMPKRALRNKS